MILFDTTQIGKITRSKLHGEHIEYINNSGFTNNHHNHPLKSLNELF